MINRFLEFKFISPISNYKFNKSSYNYYLVITNMSNDNNIVVNKIHLKNIDNINETIRSYFISRSIKLCPSDQVSYNINLFEHNKSSNIITLLFSGLFSNEGRNEININKTESNNKAYILLNRVFNSNVSTEYKDVSSFLNEKFFNIETVVRDTIKNERNCCILFFSKSFKTDNRIIVPDNINGSSKEYIYFRYASTLIKEVIFNKKKPMYIDRPIKYHPFKNNLITTTVDGRLRGFVIENDLTFKIYNKQIKLQNLVDAKTVNQLLEGSGSNGYLSRVVSQDHNAVHMPYSGYLKQVGIFNRGDYTFTGLKFDSDYFIPPGVHERDYASVILGNYTYSGVGVGAGTRPSSSCFACDDYIRPQPNTRLIFTVILINHNNHLKNSRMLTNPKLMNFLKNCPKNKYATVVPEPIWMQQGEKIGELVNDGSYPSYTITMFNRNIEFTSDIMKYSIYSDNKKDCLIRLNDMVGQLL